ncbi:MAG: hypothetical protein PHV82_18540 [Victivallaceae bacterium]|nr:hypothetical protein [Victivallaceae bacterium]
MEVRQLYIYFLILLVTNSTIMGLAVWLIKKYFEHKFRLSTKKSEANLQRITTLFDNAVIQTKLIHNHIAVLRKKIAFVFDNPKDQINSYKNP